MSPPTVGPPASRVRRRHRPRDGPARSSSGPARSVATPRLRTARRQFVANALPTFALLVAFDVAVVLQRFLVARVFALAFLLLVPGVLIVATSRTRPASGAVRLALVVAASTGFLMVAALGSSLVLPHLGVAQPLSRGSMVVLVNEVLGLLTLLVARVREPIASLLEDRVPSAGQVAVVLAFGALPLAAVGAAEAVNHGAGPAPAVVVLVASGLLLVGLLFASGAPAALGAVHRSLRGGRHGRLLVLVQRRPALRLGHPAGVPGLLRDDAGGVLDSGRSRRPVPGDAQHHRAAGRAGPGHRDLRRLAPARRRPAALRLLPRDGVLRRRALGVADGGVRRGGIRRRAAGVRAADAGDHATGGRAPLLRRAGRGRVRRRPARAVPPDRRAARRLRAGGHALLDRVRHVARARRSRGSPTASSGSCAVGGRPARAPRRVLVAWVVLGILGFTIFWNFGVTHSSSNVLRFAEQAAERGPEFLPSSQGRSLLAPMAAGQRAHSTSPARSTPQRVALIYDAGRALAERVPGGRHERLPREERRSRARSPAGCPRRRRSTRCCSSSSSQGLVAVTALGMVVFAWRRRRDRDRARSNSRSSAS